MDTKVIIHQSTCKPLHEILEEVMANIIRNRETKDREKITSNQLTTIFSIARDRGISQKELTAIIKTHFDKELVQLSIQEASDVIKGLLQ